MLLLSRIFFPRFVNHEKYTPPECTAQSRPPQCKSRDSQAAGALGLWFPEQGVSCAEQLLGQLPAQKFFKALDLPGLHPFRKRTEKGGENAR